MMKLHLTTTEGSHFTILLHILENHYIRILFQENCKNVVETSLMRPLVQPTVKTSLWPAQDSVSMDVQPRTTLSQPCPVLSSYHGEFGSVTFVNPLQVVTGCFEISPEPSLPSPSRLRSQWPLLWLLDHLGLELGSLS